MLERGTDHRSPLLGFGGRVAPTASGVFLVRLVGVLILLTLPTSVRAWRPQDEADQEKQQPAITASKNINKTESNAAPKLDARRGLIAAYRKDLPVGTVVHVDAGPYSGIYTVGENNNKNAGSGTFGSLLIREIFGHKTDSTTAATDLITIPDHPALPVGTHVRLVATAYSGEHVAADTSGTARGRKIDIWVPSADEAMRFGRRDVTLVVLSACNTEVLRSDLEKRYVTRRITEAEYRAMEQELIKLENRFYKETARFMIKRGATLQSAAYSPNKLNTDVTHKKSLSDTFNERLSLQLDFDRKLIPEGEYENRKQQIIQTEREIARENAYSGADMVDYYEMVSYLPGKVRQPPQLIYEGPSTPERFVPLAMPSVAFIAALLTFYISFKKNKLEAAGLEIQKKEMELKEIQAQETIEKTELLLRTKELQIVEMELKVKQLQSQTLPEEKRLLVL